MIERIGVHPVEIPMDRPFVHAGKRRTRTASVLVTVETAGVRGWGEGAPRRYVTGETVDSVVRALRRLEPRDLDAMVDLTDFPTAMRDLARADLIGLLQGSTGEPPEAGNANGSGAVVGGAAAAALELALFDLACRLHARPGVAGLHQVPAVRGLLRDGARPVPVSLVLDLSRDPATALARLSAPGTRPPRHVKLKATDDIDECVRRVTAVRTHLGAGPTISVDVNGAWDAPAALRVAPRLCQLGVAWLEEPVAARDWDAMREIRRTGMPVMLDESCTGVADVETAAVLGAADHINARVSKCGGVFATLALIAAARERGLGAQLGVHVGEIGPLWAAARLLSCSVRELVTAEAGRQDEWFPTPLTEPPYAVDRQRYVADPLPGVGLGVVPAEGLLAEISTPDETWTPLNQGSAGRFQ